MINERGDILYASRRTSRYLEPPVGKTNLNIFAMARPGLSPDLGIAVRQAIARGRPVASAGLAVTRRPRAPPRRPVRDPDGRPGVAPGPAPGRVRGRGAAPRSARATRKGGAGASGSARPTASSRSSRPTSGPWCARWRRRSSQVQITNEELQSTNQELQSTNEEVTTSREELQSLNEELQTLNAELQLKNDQLATANDDLRNLLDSTQIPTLFLDNALRIKRFTGQATRIANVLPGDVGRAVTDITLKVDYPELARDVADVLDSLVFKEVQVTGSDGTSYTARIHPYRTMANLIDGVVITFSDVTALRRAEEELAARAHDTVVAHLLDRWPGLVYVRDLVLDQDVYLNERARTLLRDATDGGATRRSASRRCITPTTPTQKAAGERR